MKTLGEVLSSLAFSFTLVYMYNIILPYVQAFYSKKQTVYAKKYNISSREDAAETAYMLSFCIMHCIMGQIS